MHQAPVNGQVVGLDLRRGGPYLATVDGEDETRRVTKLQSSNGPTDGNPSWHGADRVALAVPDASVMVKCLNVPAGVQTLADEVVDFELAESLLEDPAAFLFQSAKGGQSDRRLGMIYRRETLSGLAEHAGLADLEPSRLSFASRALALGRGYLGFCERTAGEFIGLVDLAGSAASVCFIVQDRVADLAWVDLRGIVLDTDTGRRQFAIDLKTVVNFRRAALQDRGVTWPLSALIVSGDQVDGHLREIIRGFFPGGVEAPRFRQSLINADSNATSENPELFLVALGLTSN
jgi:hypothetical protein